MGCCGSSGCHGCIGTVAPIRSEPIKEPKKGKEEKKPKTDDEKDGKEVSLPSEASAVLVVSLPADATLKIDNAATKSTSDVRAFQSPLLKEGLAYTYTLKAEVVRAGATKTLTKTVNVKPGEVTTVSLYDFEAPASSVASTR